MGINALEAAALCILLLLVIGPAKLPDYAAGLGRLVRTTKVLVSSARLRLDEELGEELKDIEWQSLDPRRYDPRVIVREALLDELPTALPAAGHPADPAPQRIPKGTSS